MIRVKGGFSVSGFRGGGFKVSEFTVLGFGVVWVEDAASAFEGLRFENWGLGFRV